MKNQNLFLGFLGLILIIAFVAIAVKYGNKPMSDVPLWVWWLFH